LGVAGDCSVFSRYDVSRMPNDRILPPDSAEALRLARKRATAVQKVKRWRKRHPEKARALYRDCKELQRLRQRARIRRRCMRAG